MLRFIDGHVTLVLDNRTDQLPGYTYEIVSQCRNAPGGFWVASTRPEAAHQALSESFDASALQCAGLFSDGTSRLAERHNYSWGELLKILERDGPNRLIGRVRAADEEAASGEFRGKLHDDATAVLCSFD